MSEEKEISERIDLLKDLNEQLDDYDSFLDTMFTNKDFDYNKLMEEIDPKERCDLNWNFAFSTYTLYYSN
jgi:hypothetical protein